MYHSFIRLGVVGLLACSALPAFAVQVTDNLKLGGAVRARVDYDPDRDISKLSFDTLRLYAKYDSDSWIGAVQYRFYGGSYPYTYTKKLGDISFPEYAWVGYKFDENRQVQVGLNQVPFGLLPYYSSSVVETLGNLIGLEDFYEVGGKYIQQIGDWNIQGGYYARPAFDGKGTSRGGLTYSNVPSKADDYVEGGANNQERNTFAVRAVKDVDIGGWKTEVGASALTSTLENLDTDDKGRRNAIAVHISGKNGPWSGAFLAGRQQMSPRNQGSDDVVTFGSFDSTHNVASRGNLIVADLNYDVRGKFFDDWVHNVRLYGNYSAFLKSGEDYQDTQRYIAGAGFWVGDYAYIATEWIFGRDDPYIGGSSFTQSMAAGGTNHWENQVLMSIGLYF